MNLKVAYIEVLEHTGCMGTNYMQLLTIVIVPRHSVGFVCVPVVQQPSNVL